MLDRSPDDSLRVLRSAASASAVTSPRSRDRSPSSMCLNPLVSVFFMTCSKLHLLIVVRAVQAVIFAADSPEPCYGKVGECRLSNRAAQNVTGFLTNGTYR